MPSRRRSTGNASSSPTSRGFPVPLNTGDRSRGAPRRPVRRRRANAGQPETPLAIARQTLAEDRKQQQAVRKNSSSSLTGASTCSSASGSTGAQAKEAERKTPRNVDEPDTFDVSAGTADMEEVLRTEEHNRVCKAGGSGVIEEKQQAAEFEKTEQDASTSISPCKEEDGIKLEAVENHSRTCSGEETPFSYPQEALDDRKDERTEKMTAIVGQIPCSTEEDPERPVGNGLEAESGLRPLAHARGPTFRSKLVVGIGIASVAIGVLLCKLAKRRKT